jgi:hypothetical protein
MTLSSLAVSSLVALLLAHAVRRPPGRVETTKPAPINYRKRRREMPAVRAASQRRRSALSRSYTASSLRSCLTELSECCLRCGTLATTLPSKRNEGWIQPVGATR